MQLIYCKFIVCILYITQIKLVYNDVKRKSRELGLMHSNAYKSFIKI